jgi:hypothetical protein
MKKLNMTILMILSLFMLAGCEGILDSTDYTDAIVLLSETLADDLPLMINSDYTLPVQDGYKITWSIDDTALGNKIVYERPFYDQEKILEFTIKKGKTELSFEHAFTLTAPESGLNQNRIDLTLPVSLGQLNREDYVSASVKVETIINGEKIVELETDQAKLRGRGNSTWSLSDKKPYRLRFDNNTSILGMKAAKNYVLLAEYSDKSFMRNMIVQKMVSLMNDLPYALEVRYVELYVNNEYRGLYVLTEQVEVHKNKFALDSVPGVMDTGYFLEMDQRFYNQNIEPGYDWIVVRSIPYEIKEPDPDDVGYTANHAIYIFEYMIEVENALIAKSGYESLIDVNNWIDHFIIHELVKNVDVGWSSVFMYKEKGGVLKYGPLWDFDLAIGNADYIDYGPENFYGMRQFKNRMFKLMMEIPEIREQFKVKYRDFYDHVLPIIFDMIPVVASSIQSLANKNFTRWDIMGSYVWPNPWQVWTLTTHPEQVTYVINYLSTRSVWLYHAVGTTAYQNGQFGD